MASTEISSKLLSSKLYHLLTEKTNDISKINKEKNEGMTKECFLVFIYAVIQRINGTNTNINVT
jgi:hypothetical protein